MGFSLHEPTLEYFFQSHVCMFFNLFPSCKLYHKLFYLNMIDSHVQRIRSISQCHPIFVQSQPVLLQKKIEHVASVESVASVEILDFSIWRDLGMPGYQLLSCACEDGDLTKFRWLDDGRGKTLMEHCRPRRFANYAGNGRQCGAWPTSESVDHRGNTVEYQNIIYTCCIMLYIYIGRLCSTAIHNVT